MDGAEGLRPSSCKQMMAHERCGRLSAAACLTQPYVGAGNCSSEKREEFKTRQFCESHKLAVNCMWLEAAGRQCVLAEDSSHSCNWKGMAWLGGSC